MKLFKTVDEKLAEIGFVKVEENKQLREKRQGIWLYTESYYYS